MIAPAADGCKRLSGCINGHDLADADAEVVAEIMALADGTVSEDGLADWIRQHATKRR